jgi:tetratricopeptide (TPR) repeat protein
VARPDLASIPVALGCVHLIRAVAMVKLKQPPSDALSDAERVFGGIVRGEARSRDGHLGLGIVAGIRASLELEAKRDAKDLLAKAEERLRAAAEVDPTCADPHRWLGHVRAARRDVEGAVEAWRKAIELDPGAKEDLEALITKVRGRR